MVPEMLASASASEYVRLKGLKPKSYNIDQMMVQSMWAVINTPVEVHFGAGGLSHTALRRLARTPQVAAIIRTRANQVAEWAQEQEDDEEVGWRIVPEKRDAKVTGRMQIGMDYAKDLVKTAGGPWFLGGFEAFLRAVTRDTLIVDQVNFEIITDPLTGWPVAFVPVDPATIRRTQPSDTDVEDGRWDFNEMSFSQWIDGEEVATFTNRQMAWGIRNPRTDLSVAGWGHPEMEELIFIISNIINSMASNAANYLTGVNGRSMIIFNTKMGRERFQQMERMVHTALSGPRQNRKTPFVQLDPTLGESMSVESLGTPSNDDMQYADWINFLLKTICSLFCIDPAEMGFVFGNEQTKNQQYANSPLDRIISSKERGLRPLLRAIARWINFWVIKPYWPDLKFEFVGFDTESAKDRADRDNNAVDKWKSVNEVRVENKYEPFDDPRADRPLAAAFDQEEAAPIPNVVEFDSVGAWMNGKRARRPAFQKAA